MNQYFNMHFPSIKEFNYELPDSAVAKYPLTERDQSKLLVWNDHLITDSTFSQLPGFLPESSMLVFNNTRVIRARLNFRKSTGAGIEIFCLEPTLPHDYVLSFSQTSSCRWKCIVGNKKRWKEGVLQMCVAVGGEVGGERASEREDEGTRGREDRGTQAVGAVLYGCLGSFQKILKQNVVLKAEMVCEIEGGFEIEFSWDNPNFTFAEILEAAGNIPIPPYLHRESEEIDLSVYQTVYATIKGSVAAPTAGLHFTDKVFRALAERNISCEELTLHVGAGTFQPVKSESVGEHRMHTEYFSVNKSTISKLIAHPGSVIAVGTTSVRTLESLYWIGKKIVANPCIEPDSLAVAQWEPYGEGIEHIDQKMALQAILDWLSERKLLTLETATQIMILPGYRFRIIDGLVTNFHQPQSTLILLISAILGDDWKRVYTHALENDYRFLSYGDANLYLLRHAAETNIK
jgi:S-adenosylmethionine:tRNA ribosyltransferase-isomerase